MSAQQSCADTCQIWIWFFSNQHLNYSQIQRCQDICNHTAVYCCDSAFFVTMVSLIASFMGPIWGPSGADRTQVGPMLAPWILLSQWYVYNGNPYTWQKTHKFGLLKIKSCQDKAGNMTTFYFQCFADNDHFHHNQLNIVKMLIVVSQRCGCFVTRFCYQLIKKTGNKTVAPSWPDPYGIVQGPVFFPIIADNLEAVRCNTPLSLESWK